MSFYSNYTRFNAKQKKITHVLCSSIFRTAVGLNILYFAVYYSWHHMSPRCLLPFHVTSFPPQISQYRDRSGFLWGLYSVDSAGGLYNVSSEEAAYY